MGKKDSYVVGIDLGGTNIQAGVVDESGKVIARDDTKTKAADGPDAVLKRLTKITNRVIDDADVSRKNIAGVGIGAPGVVDEDGIVTVAVNLGWRDMPLAKRLGDALELPVVVDNDVNVGTYGEYVVGAAKGHDSVFGIFVGTGIGGGLIFNDKLYHGHFLTAGEIGHTIIRADAGPGRRSLEDLASRTAIVSLLTQLIESGKPSALTDITKGDLSKIRSKALAAALDAEDPLAEEIVQRAAHHVGATIANVVTLLSLPCVVVGGGVTEAMGKKWMQWVRSAFERVVFPEELRQCKIVASSLGDDAGVVGAALLARDEL